MEHFSYTPAGVCSRRIEFDIDNDSKVHNVRFTGGCSGNTQGVGALAEGMDALTLSERLSGIRCGSKSTSCPAQLAAAITAALRAQ